MNIIAKIENDYTAKFGIPRQSAKADKVVSKIKFEKEYAVADALRGMEGFSHLWLIWCFSENAGAKWSPTVRPPRLGGNKRMGVFATRSPFRPNPIGLSAVKIERIDFNEPAIYVTGADLMNGTPIYDIKPYLPYNDSIPDAKGGFADNFVNYKLSLSYEMQTLSIIPEEKRAGLLQILEQDPRPSYQNDGERIYGLSYAGFEVKFTVKDSNLNIIKIEKGE